ncbi:MAG: ATP-binding cassette domain-containing protein [Candidatus Omnitrophica bacterium]|nr:ATP-binding cassette domain-containing protein [Candidatus Omnitrophota bacterium]
MIQFHQVSKSYDEGLHYSVRNLTFQIEDGETLILLGSSGCGKTTTLKLINRLIDPTEGRIEINGRSVMDYSPVALRRSIGYVFQGIGLFPHMTVLENIGIVLRLTGAPRADRCARARELLEWVDLDPDLYADRFPDELSGGQQQRVGVARALASNPDILLMDEPFGALDALTRETLQQEMLRIKRRLQKTVVFVTHDIQEAITLGDRIAVMHEGRLEQIASVGEIINNPATSFVRSLFETIPANGR